MKIALGFWNVAADGDGGFRGDRFALKDSIQSRLKIMDGWRGPGLAERDEAVVDAATVDLSPINKDRGLRGDAYACKLDERMPRVAQNLQMVFIRFDVLTNHLDRHRWAPRCAPETRGT